jgi:hypothetical protein
VIKLSSVLTDLHGVTGRDIMGRLIAGERDPKVLAQLARAKISELAAALEGAEFFTAEHAALLKTMLDRIDRIDAEITRLSQTIERLLAPWEEQLQQAESMPGWRRYLARPDIFHLHGVTGAMAVEILAAHIPATDGAAALAHVHAEHAALYAATEPVTHPHPASPPGSELTVAAVRSLDPHQVKLVEACQRGHAATGDPAFAAAAETVTGLHA